VGLEFLVDTSWLLGIPQTIVVAIKSSERLNLRGAECESKSCEPRLCKASIYGNHRKPVPKNWHGVGSAGYFFLITKK
jgi:hypothetical protein